MRVTKDSSSIRPAVGKSRARVTRQGVQLCGLWRTSVEDMERDQHALNHIIKNMILDRARQMSDEITTKRNCDVALGEVGGKVSRPPKRQRTQEAVRPSTPPSAAGSDMMASFATSAHNENMQRALHDEAMRCFNFISLVGQVRLLHNNDTNAFPGMRNLGNTCLVNACLQLFMHVASSSFGHCEPEAFGCQWLPHPRSVAFA